MKQQLNVVFVIKCMSLPGGGAERVLAIISRGLEQRGHKISVLSQDSADSPDYYPVSARRIRQGRKTPALGGRLRRVLGWLPTLRRTMISEKPDVAVGFMHSGYLPLAVACLRTGIPVIASEHTVYAHYDPRPAERLLLQFSPYLVDRITVVSQQARDSFPLLLRRKMVVVPNPVARPGPVCAQPNLTKRSLLVAVGRLDIAKDHATLIDAFAQVAIDWPDWDLEIAGEGECRAKLERQIASHGLNARVRLLGAIADIDSLLGRADLFAMASRYESFGLATAEALMRGVPAVGFADCPGTNELIVDGFNGLLVQPGTDRSSSLAVAIGSLFASGKLRGKLAANAPGSVAGFQEDAVLDRWEEILFEAAKAQHGHG